MNERKCYVCGGTHQHLYAKKDGTWVHAECTKETSKGYTRIEIYEGPNKQGNYHYALFWMADYHPGHPDGEYGLRERGQHFRAPIPEWTDSLKQVDKR